MSAICTIKSLPKAYLLYSYNQEPRKLLSQSRALFSGKRVIFGQEIIFLSSTREAEYYLQNSLFVEVLLQEAGVWNHQLFKNALDPSPGWMLSQLCNCVKLRQHSKPQFLEKFARVPVFCTEHNTDGKCEKQVHQGSQPQNSHVFSLWPDLGGR